RENGGHGARLRLDTDNVSGESLLPWETPLREYGVADQSVESSGFIKNWWFGLSALHTLFAREHNAIVNMLEGTDDYQQVEPGARDEWLYQTARLINGALMAKIHTVEWTTTLLNDPMIQLGLLLDWWGINVDELKAKLPDLARLPADHLWKLITAAIERDGDGIAQMVVENRPADRHAPSPVEKDARHQDIMFAMSEEFVSVYRMHALLREQTTIHTLGGERPETVSLKDGSFGGARPLVEKHGLASIFLTLGREEPGALRLRNYPKSLVTLTVSDSPSPIDLGAVDILRDRERGVPRYAAFKRYISHIRGPYGPKTSEQPIKRFEDICGDPAQSGVNDDERTRRERDLAALRTTYANVDDVDLLVGMLCEPLPDGFAFSWTAFEIFLLMTPLRLSVDRFFTDDYRAEIYTQAGLNWINQETMQSVLIRHYPELADVLTDEGNPFLQSGWRDI
ncbi:MAG: peroxidase family protein, partial [Pseudomonadota bacterium]